MASHWVISHRKQPARSLARSPARSHVGPGQETQRSRETVGLVPPSVSAVGNLPVVPKKKKKTRLGCSTFSVHQHAPWNKGTCTHNHTHFFPSSPPCSRAIFFDQKHFLRICCPPSDDFQTSSVIWWRADGSRSRICLEKAPGFGLNKVEVSDLCPGSLPGRAWTYVKWDWVTQIDKRRHYLISGDGILAQRRNFTLSSIILPFVSGQSVVWDKALKLKSACSNSSLRTVI